MSEFLISFLANLAADSILAVALYFILTQPSEKKKAQAAVSQSLGLIKAEALINISRASAFAMDLSEIILHFGELPKDICRQRLHSNR